MKKFAISIRKSNLRVNYFKIPFQSWHFQNVVCLLCAFQFHITKDIENLIHISTVLVLLNKIEISPVILMTAKILQNSYWKSQDLAFSLQDVLTRIPRNYCVYKKMPHGYKSCHLITMLIAYWETLYLSAEITLFGYSLPLSTRLNIVDLNKS